MERSVTASFNRKMASKNDDDNDLSGEDKKDRILDCAIHYVLNKTYPCELEKGKERAVRKCAAMLVLRMVKCLSSRRAGKSR